MIYLMRHGLDDESYVGGYSDVDLIDEGVEQVDDVGKWLCEMNYTFENIYTSDIKRAVTTANIINEYLNIPVLLDKNLRELNKGILNGMKKDDAMNLYFKYMINKDINMKYPNGESMMDFYLRIRNLLTYFSKYENSLVITHRGVINMIYYILLRKEVDFDKERFGVVHASVHELDLNKSKIRRIR